MKYFLKALKDQKAATAIEYGLIAALIAVAAVSAMTALGKSISGEMNITSADM